MKRVRALFFALILLVISASPFSFKNNDEIAVASAFSSAPAFYTSAKAMALIEQSSGRVLACKNESAPLANASTTKIATAITVINNCKDLGRKVKITKDMTNISGTSIYLKEGEVLTVKELLYGLLLRSGNDCAVALALTVSKNLPTFCELMNKTCKLAGATNTNFCNPHGLDEKGHHTTALDLAKITGYALSNSVFSEICATRSVTICEGTKSERNLTNKNKLLNTLTGCIGVKTGFTNDAGRCLVSACERDGLKLICVVLNCGPMFEESAQIFETAYKSYKMFDLLLPNKTNRNVKVSGGYLPYVHTYTSRGFRYPLTTEEYLAINYDCDLPEVLSAPIKKQQKVGKIKIFFSGDLLFEENIYTMEEVNLFQGTSWFKKVVRKWLN